MRFFTTLRSALTLVALTTSIASAQIPVKYPLTVKGDVTDDYFGNKIADPYRWLEDDRSEKRKPG